MHMHTICTSLHDRCLSPARSRDACLPLELPPGDYTLLPFAVPAAAAAAGAGAGAAAAEAAAEAQAAAAGRHLAVSAHAVVTVCNGM